ncbi:suppressor of cytokine signaling 1-like [Lethenteron reissneri]|uniref:suppressor of cytokine signaling 1-like n=1 Tax=Lethenteron reissneri TaxID=7753 RepID=UPI002AB6FA27|nr:suppressor of cytokine signaling 1-like [Lethenteron reissneri]XP_061416792.1 suppressor of cytokine signaling 1-like [Lethenteron reissneri]XP_061416793.1 suppressor of cytokine signaling 1-like [Lethenteron reissneri]XP_061416794.1 suppressor of cytokine signaling 1-like [Lethenteron reissneri]XP_061416795.1 suppressor of cytokine signaling 1-like [Lethenteron reissneri]XP_061416796.1 suppressor of cytokine signaling 1-like [Lethenteron reissneri]XP_061416797.1 suppressor of cytokine sig
MALGAGRPVTAATGAEPEKLKRDRRRRGGQASVGNGGDRGVANDNGNVGNGRGNRGGTGGVSGSAGGDGGGVRTHFHTFPCLEDFCAVQRSHRMLEESGFYWGHLSSAEAAAALLGKPVGTFLVRDSRHGAHFFSLSAVTERGPTSVRVHFRAGAFALDTVQEAVHAAPRFASLMELIEHYMGESRRLDRAGGGGGGDDDGGDRRHRRRDGARYCVTHDDGTRLPLLLSRPLPRHAGAPPSMQHACRRAIHRAVPGERLAELPLPAPLRDFLESYPSQV